MILQDFHVHTTFCDGKNSAEEMVLAAIDLGMKKIGFSSHSYTSFDESYCIKKSQINLYKQEIFRLKEKYKDMITVLCGIEQDIFSDMPAVGYDYVIGSVHYLKKDNHYLPVDESEETFKNIAVKYFGGDFIRFSQYYFDCVGNVVSKTKANIIGHFDLISKFNEGGKLFCESDFQYITYGIDAIKKLIRFNAAFEINTGAISRGYRTIAYPNEIFIKKIHSLGGKFILSSDAHSAETLCYKFSETEYMAKNLGLNLVNL